VADSKHSPLHASTARPGPERSKVTYLGNNGVPPMLLHKVMDAAGGSLVKRVAACFKCRGMHRRATSRSAPPETSNAVV